MSWLSCNPVDYSLSGFSICGISQASILERVTISFFRASSWPRDQACISCLGRRILYRWATREALWRLVVVVVSLSHCLTLEIPWTIAYPAPPSVGFSRQEHWSGLPFASPEEPPSPGIKPGSPALQADSLPTSGWLRTKFQSRRKYKDGEKSQLQREWESGIKDNSIDFHFFSMKGRPLLSFILSAKISGRVLVMIHQWFRMLSCHDSSILHRLAHLGWSRGDCWLKK